MRYKIVIICLFLLLLSGYLDGRDIKRNLTMGNVTQSIKGQSIKLSEKGKINEPLVVLDNVKPYGYWIGKFASLCVQVGKGTRGST